MTEGSSADHPRSESLPAVSTATGTGSWYLVLDIAIVVVIVGFVVSFVGVRARLASSDGDARAIAGWAKEQGVDRVAWPAALREAVPALFAAGVTPILTADDVAAQQLAVNRTPIVVSRGPVQLDRITRLQFTSGGLVARSIDLDAAASTPLKAGQVAGEEISRPYRYSPIYDSRKLPDKQPWVQKVTLAPATYTFASELFFPNGDGRADVEIQAGDNVLARKTFRLTGRVVDEAKSVSFAVDGKDPREVELRITPVLSEGKGPAFMQRWMLARAEGVR